MGYIKSTPVMTMLAESCTLPIKLQIEFISSKFITRLLYFGNKYIIEYNHLNNFKLILEKNHNFELIPTLNKFKKIPSNLKLYTTNFNHLTKTEIKNLVDSKKQYYVSQNYFTIFTDGSKQTDKCGI